MDFSMTWTAEGNAKGKVEEAFFTSGSGYKFLPEMLEGDDVVMGVEVDGSSNLAPGAALLAGVTITSEYRVSPSYISLGFTQNFLFLGFTVPPVSRLLSRPLRCPLNLRDQKLSGLRVVAGDEERDAEAFTMHVGFNFDSSSATAMAKVLPLVIDNPQIHTSVVSSGVVSRVRLSTVDISDGSSHPPHDIKFNRDLQVKWDELLETPPEQSEGNQQPSQEYTSGRFRDYWSGKARLITSKSVPRESDDIVRALGNKGSHVNGLKFNSGTLIKSRYCPGTGAGSVAAADGIATVGTTANLEAIDMLQQTSNGAVTAYPFGAGVSGEVLFWLQARKPFLNFYMSTDPEFGLGFTGFKPHPLNTSIVGQILFAGNITVHPRYSRQLYNITG